MKKLLFSFEGRISKGDFWKGFGIIFIVVLSLGFILPLLPFNEFISPVIGVLVYYMLFAISAKRYHDHGKTGWWCLLWFLPLVGWLFVLIECGTGPKRLLKNQYGEPV